MKTLSPDITVVGAGIAGLWSAKELVDQGMSVCVVERSPTLAAGATTRNEGWLHAGTYHAQGIVDETEARVVTGRTRYGHEEILRFAPESIDHDTSYALSLSSTGTETAVDRWDNFAIPYREVSPADLDHSVGLDTSRVHAAFEVEDKSVNSVALCTKLTRYILDKGGIIIPNAKFRPESDTQAQVNVAGRRKYCIASEKFLLTAGSGTNKLIEKVTGEPLPMRYFKAHLLVAPRLTIDNYFYLDVGEAGVMNHGSTSMIGINRDGIELSEPDYEVSAEKETLLREALARMLPAAFRNRKLAELTVAIACCKPDIYRSRTDTQNLNVQVFDIAPGYVCALPGKMTEAPYLGKVAAAHVISRQTPQARRPVLPLQYKGGHDLKHTVTPRPADVRADQYALVPQA